MNEILWKKSTKIRNHPLLAHLFLRMLLLLWRWRKRNLFQFIQLSQTYKWFDQKSDKFVWVKLKTELKRRWTNVWLWGDLKKIDKYISIKKIKEVIGFDFESSSDIVGDGAMNNKFSTNLFEFWERKKSLVFFCFFFWILIREMDKFSKNRAGGGFGKSRSSKCL